MYQPFNDEPPENVQILVKYSRLSISRTHRGAGKKFEISRVRDIEKGVENKENHLSAIFFQRGQ